jgi:nucleoside-diphosphate kinase
MQTNLQTTFVIIKPNGVKGGIIGEIISRFEKSRLSVAAISLRNITRAETEGFYAEHKERGFFGELVDFMTSGPVVLLALTGEKAVETVRHMNGATNPANALPGTIRFDYAPNTGENVVHSSDSVESAARELEYWFQAGGFSSTGLTNYAAASHVLG